MVPSQVVASFYPCLRLRLHGAGQIFGRPNIWSLRPCVYTGPAKRPQIRSLRRANIRPPRKASFLKLGRPNSRVASCKRLWPTKYLHSTKKRVSMRATKANTKREIEILGPKLMYCCWLESLVRFCVCSLCFVACALLKISTTFVESLILKFKTERHIKDRKFTIIDSSYVSNPL